MSCGVVKVVSHPRPPNTAARTTPHEEKPLINGDQDARLYKKRALVNGDLDDLSNKKIER